MALVSWGGVACAEPKLCKRWRALPASPCLSSVHQRQLPHLLHRRGSLRCRCVQPTGALCATATPLGKRRAC